MNVFRPVPYQFDRLFGPVSGAQYGDRDLLRAAGIVESRPARPALPPPAPARVAGAGDGQAETAAAGPPADDLFALAPGSLAPRIALTAGSVFDPSRTRLGLIVDLAV